MLIEQPAVLVVGRQAAMLAAILRRLEEAGTLDTFPPLLAAELRVMGAEFDAAGRAWFGREAVPRGTDLFSVYAGQTVAAVPRGTDSCESSANLPVSIKSIRDHRSSNSDAELIDTKEAAEILGCSPRNVRARAESGSLPGRKIDGRWLLQRPAVMAEVRRRARG